MPKTFNPDTGRVWRGGFQVYSDLATVSTPIAVSADTDTVITNDGLGAQSIIAPYAPPLVTNLFNTSTDAFDWSGVPFGSIIHIRFDANVTTSSPNQEVDIFLESGQGGFLYTTDFVGTTYKSSGTHHMSAESFIYIVDSNTQGNPSQFMINTDSAADVEVLGWVIQVSTLS